MRVFLDENFPDYKFFSIDQMGFMNDYTLNKNGIVTQYNEKLKIINPEILIKGDTLFSSDYYDSKVLSPMRSPAYWFHEKSDIFSKEIKLSPPESTEYIDVYNSNLSESRMPVYRTKIKNIDNYSIYLPKSDYRVKYFNKKFEEVR